MKKTIKKSLKYGQIMGINVFSTSASSLLTRVADLLSDSAKFRQHNPSSKLNPHKFSIVTPNSELVLMAQKNTQLRHALNSSDFPIPDSIGINYAFKYLFGKSINIIPGRVLFGKLIEL